MIVGYYNSPIGQIKITHSGKGVSALIFLDEEIQQQEIPDILKPAINQLDDYFSGKRKTFDLRLDISGTAFQKQVWSYLIDIPYGTTETYLNIAKKTGDVKTIRAVGNANGKNPVSIIIPCHRVIGSDGSLTGYAGGLWRKEWLLNREQKYKQLSLF